jgi:hypothetical protein
MAETKVDDYSLKPDKKTTPDEGKTFDKDTVCVCVQNCYQNGTRYRGGDTVTGRKCPPWFEAKPAAPEERKK